MEKTVIPELKSYGPGWNLVDSLDKVDHKAMTVETSWKVPDSPEELQLWLADHFPPPNKPILPGVMQLQVLAEFAGARNFRVTKIEGVAFRGFAGPGKIRPTLEITTNEPETEVDPITWSLSGSLARVGLARVGEDGDKIILEVASMVLEELFEPVDGSTAFLTERLTQMDENHFDYAGNEIIVPKGLNLPNMLLAEHMCQTCITINAAMEEYRENQFWLTGIKEAEFLSDVAWGEKLRSTASVEIDAKTRRGVACATTFLDDIPVAEMELTFAVVKSKKV